MKKVIILTFCILSCFSYVNAQDYNEYLAVARQHLADGNIEKAQKAYSIYCNLSESRDIAFEQKIEESRLQKDWKSKCLIIPLDETTMIAVQKIPAEQVPVSLSTANQYTELSTLGGFSDWRLPTKDELSKIISSIPNKELYSGETNVFSGYYHAQKQTSAIAKATRSAYGTHVESWWTETYYVVDINNTLKTTYSEKSKSAPEEYDSRTIVNQTGNKWFLANYMIVRTFLKADESVTAPQTQTKVDVSVKRTRIYSY